MIKLAEISYIENELSALEKEAPEVYASQRSELTDEYIEKEAEIEIPLSSSSTLNVQRMRLIQGCKWARDRQKGYSGEFIEWIAFDGLEMFPMTGKDGDGKIRWFDLQDGEKVDPQAISIHALWDASEDHARSGFKRWIWPKLDE